MTELNDKEFTKCMLNAIFSLLTNLNIEIPLVMI